MMVQGNDHILLAETDIGNPDGLPSDSLTVVVKDSIDLAGLPTRGASRALEDAPPAAAHAEVVQRLLEGGCRIVGKSNMHELAYGMTGVNAWTGTPVNTIYPGRIPGGSSSGSAAAVAAGIARVGIGTDTGGSIRMPAACCGVFGLKPTFGLVSRKGAVPAESTLDCIGPFATTIDDIERAMELIAPGFIAQPAPASIRLGVFAGPAGDDVAQAFDTTITGLAGSGIEIAHVKLPGLDYAFNANMTVIASETYAAFGHLLATGRIGPDVAARLTNAGKVDAEALSGAEEVRARFTAEVDGLLRRFDAIVMPALSDPAPTIEETADPSIVLRLSKLLRPFNITGHPAIVIPHETAAGLPYGLQLVGRKYKDAMLCALARAIVARLADATPEDGSHLSPIALPSSKTDLS